MFKINSSSNTIDFVFPTWHLTSMSKKTSSPSGCSSLASSWLYREGVWGESVLEMVAEREKPTHISQDASRDTEESKECLITPSPFVGTWSALEVEGVWGGLEVLRRKPGKWLRLTRWSSSRRAWELASSSRKWLGSCDGVSHAEIARSKDKKIICGWLCWDRRVVPLTPPL